VEVLSERMAGGKTMANDDLAQRWPFSHQTMLGSDAVATDVDVRLPVQGADVRGGRLP
jgi:hypothetical protein